MGSVKSVLPGIIASILSVTAIASVGISADSVPTVSEQCESTTVFAAAKVDELRTEAGKLLNPPEKVPDGWSKSTVDPMKVVLAFKPLHVKKGYTLRAYQFREDLGTNAFVWAMPEKAIFPEPAKCRQAVKRLGFLYGPKPPQALENVMEAIEGDGSAWSFLCASILQRELDEFGASWHGLSWSTHEVLDRNPWKSGKAKRWAMLGKDTKWIALEPEPKEWQPQVQIGKDKVTVTFYTYSGHHRQTIYRHVDTYKPGTYYLQSERKEIAKGPWGYEW
jgi:hypothetical protein